MEADKKGHLNEVTKTMDEVKIKLDKTVRRQLGQSSSAMFGEAAAVDVKDVKILRIRLYHHDEKYTKEELNPWKIEKNREIIEPPWCSTSPLSNRL